MERDPMLHHETKETVADYCCRNIRGNVLDVRRFVVGLLEILEAEARRSREVAMLSYQKGQRDGRWLLMENLKGCTKN